jgi:hypothetical protein
MFLGSTAQPVRKADNLTAICEPTVWESGIFNISQPYKPPRPVMVIKTKLSLRTNYTDRLSAKLVSTFAARGWHEVCVTDPYGRILAFLDRPLMATALPKLKHALKRQTFADISYIQRKVTTLMWGILENDSGTIVSWSAQLHNENISKATAAASAQISKFCFHRAIPGIKFRTTYVINLYITRAYGIKKTIPNDTLRFHVHFSQRCGTVLQIKW